MKRIFTMILAAAMCLSLCVPAFATGTPSSTTIPERMMPNSIITYGKNLEITIEFDKDANRPTTMSEQNETPDLESRASEDALFAQVKEDAKALPSTQIMTSLPTPVPGMMVIYGSDGGINHIYYPEGTKAVMTRSSHVSLGTRRAAGTYTFGAHDNTITITNSSVTGEGRFTVFRAGVNGSNAEGRGSSGKLLETGDVATNWNYDNPYHNTAIDARALDTNIKKTVYKNDIGELPDAVLDVYFWGWDYQYFGYMYSDTLSFAGRYYYSF